jgi:CheY-like chemotaxis protein
MAPRVVVVDDDAENCRALSEFLRAEGFEVLPFLSGDAAWSAIESQELQPDAVVSDIRMPGVDGIGLLRRLRDHFANLPVILVSAYPDKALWDEALRAGALQVLSKPIQGSALVQILLALWNKPSTQNPGL